MAEALRLARRGRGTVSPNPMVGAVVVRRGRIVGRGYHRAAGEPHAEIVALESAGKSARGADLYVTLEPCCHTGRTGACTEAIAAAGIAKVIAAVEDPFPLVAGKGIRALRRAGVEVVVGDGAGEAAALNEAFFLRVREGRPWVDLKMASTVDGEIADHRGRSRWITGEASRREVHRLRLASDAVLVGIGTVLADDPRLDARAGRRRKVALRVVLDRDLRTPPRARLLGAPGAIVVARPEAPEKRRRALQNAGAEIWTFRSWRAGRVRLPSVLRRLARRGVNRLLVEGGGEVAGAFLAAGLVDRLHQFVAPRALGAGRDLFAGLGERSLGGAARLRFESFRRRGEDLWIRMVREDGSCSPA